MTNKSAFTSSEWQLIKDAPYWVQTAITVAEGRMSFVEKRLEGKALANFLESYETKNGVIKDVLAAVAEGDHDVDAKASAEDVQKALGRIKSIMERKATRAEADEFNSFLLGAGDAIVTASSEGLLSRGEKISDEEAEAMRQIADALEATPAHKRQRAAAAASKKRADDAAAKRKADAAAKAKAAADKAKAEAEAEAAREKREKEAAARKADYDRKVRDAQAQRRQREVEEAAAKRKAEAEAKKAAEEAAAAARAALPRHTVQSGETLSHIAMKHLGSANRWREIYEANKDTIDNPSLIYPGQEIIIPQ